jgi:hypothetical protein
MVRDYEILCEQAGAWRRLAKVEAQWQRRAVHALDPAAVCLALRVQVLATWGVPEARLVRIGAYAAGGGLAGP